MPKRWSALAERMLWRRRSPSLPTEPSPVPDVEQVRLRALRASWQRDRQVGQRRLAWRWTLWYALRYRWWFGGLLVLVVALLWWWTVPDRAQPSIRQGPLLAHIPPPSSPPVSTASNQQPMTWPMPIDTADGNMPLALRPDTGWQGVSVDGHRLGAPPGVTLPATDGNDPATNPSLHFENWLHSKEI